MKRNRRARPLIQAPVGVRRVPSPFRLNATKRPGRVASPTQRPDARELEALLDRGEVIHTRSRCARRGPPRPLHSGRRNDRASEPDQADGATTYLELSVSCRAKCRLVFQRRPPMESIARLAFGNTPWPGRAPLKVRSRGDRRRHRGQGLGATRSTAGRWPPSAPCVPRAGAGAHALLVAVHRNTPNSRSPLRMVVTSTKLTLPKPKRASCSVRRSLSNP